MKKPVQHGGDSGRIAQKFAPIVDGPVGGQHRAGAFVAAHDANRAGPHPSVGADRRLVVGGRVDGDAVVAAPLKQVVGQGAERVGA